MDLREDSSRYGSLPAATLRNLSSSSSAFFSANQSPFLTPRPSNCQLSESTRSDAQFDPPSTSARFPDPVSLANEGFSLPEIVSNSPLSSYSNGNEIGYSELRNHRQNVTSHSTSFSPVPASLSRFRSYDIFIGLHGRKPSLLRFANWLRVELEIQGLSCFVSDRSRCRSSRKHGIIERAMDVSSFGVVILTRKSFKNPYSIEEIRFFSSKKNLVPIFFDLSPEDCLVRDIEEKRGELWEKHGGELWLLYGGIEKEWKEAVNGLSRVDEWKLEAQDGNWRDCILRAVTLLAMRLGRRSVMDRITKWREKAEREEFPFPRNENFVGRKKELSDLEFVLFGDISGETEKDYIELKARRRKKKNVSLGWSKSGSADERRRGKTGKGKEPVIWKESEKEIEMQSSEIPKRRNGARYGRRKRSAKVLYGRGVACVSGESGIGKTELLLEFAYRFHQRYKMVLWIGGESRYIRQNYLNLWSFLDIDVGIENCSDKTRIRSFEEQEEAAVSRVRKEMMRNIPFLVIIDNLESEKDWWDKKLVMDLLPRFGGETHIIISTRLPRVMNLDSLKLSYLSGIEAMSLMQGGVKDYPVAEIDALRAIEEKVGRLTLGLSVVGAILSELPINPSRLLDTINRMPLRDFAWGGRGGGELRKNVFLLQLFEVCFSIFDHADGPRSLATRMVQVCGWFAPGAVPVSLLALAANKIPEKRKGRRFWRKIVRSLSCGFSTSYSRRSEAEEASSMLVRFNIARTSNNKQGGHNNNNNNNNNIHFSHLIKLYSRKRCITGGPHAVVQAIITRGSISHHQDHVWAACFLLFGFNNDSPIVSLKVSELLYLVKEVILPLAIRTFITSSRCQAPLELLRLATETLEAADQSFVTPVEKWLDKSLCCRQIHTSAQLNPCLWQDLALTRATVLETRAKLMLRGGQFDVGDDLIRKAIFIRSSICGEEHPETVSAHQTLSKLTRLLASVQNYTSP